MASLLSPEALRDPYAFCSALRDEHGPVCWSRRHRAWLLTSYAEVATGFRDARLSSDRLSPLERRLDDTGRSVMAPTLALLRGWMVFHDEPHHSRLRDPVRWAFTPKVVENLRAQVESIAGGLLDDVLEAGTDDLMTAFAFPLPAMVIAHLLGVPASDRHRFALWSRKLAAVVFGAADDPNQRQVANEGSAEFAEYFEWLAAKREREPGDDLVSALVAARGPGGGLAREELVGACTLLLFAGHETTTDLLANAIVALVHHPGEIRVLRDDPGLWGSAVEEFLRFDGPNKVQVRSVATPHERGGRRLEAGDLVYLVLASANRDPAEFPDPDRLDVRRSPGQHVAFGLGAHFCLGAPLARLEGQVALRALFERCEEIELTGDLSWEPLIVSRSLTSLPVSVRPARQARKREAGNHNH